MANDLFRISSGSPLVRVFLGVALLAALLFGWVAGRRQIGSMLADLTPASDPNAEEIAAIAAGMSPSDPRASWLKASVERNVFTVERTEAAVKLFEQTVRLSPFDYRWWIELARSYEQAERPVEAESALKRAVEIAPDYAFVKWQMGNFYLRQNRIDEAFAALKGATRNNHVYREQAFSLAWDYFDKDPVKLEAIAEDQPEVYAELALFYAARGRAADSIRIWNRLSDADKAAYPNITKVMAQGLYDKRFYPQSLEFARQVGIDTDTEPNTVSNAGFESALSNPDETFFGWRLNKNEGKLDIAPDGSVKHSGSRSLRFGFRGYSKAELYNIFQTVVVTPGKNYRLRFWLRTEGLKSAGGPQIEIVNANDDKLIVSSKPFPAGTNDWQEIEVAFSTPENCTGITIRTTRAFCGDNCPIVGTIWYDDFALSN